MLRALRRSDLRNASHIISTSPKDEPLETTSNLIHVNLEADLLTFTNGLAKIDDR